uniref:Uncharacterized protein n=1 Tax=Arundo donax TaxID=35708 RepID=A0A0A9AJE5_ARUDO
MVRTSLCSSRENSSRKLIQEGL